MICFSFSYIIFQKEKKSLYNIDPGLAHIVYFSVHNFLFHFHFTTDQSKKEFEYLKTWRKKGSSSSE
jgi:hypothetical protein